MERSTEGQAPDGPEEILRLCRISYRMGKGEEGLHCAAQDEHSRESLEREYVDEAYQTPTVTWESDGTTRTAHFFGEEYSSCTTPVGELHPTELDDLTIETHHRGEVLFATVLSQPRQEACIHAAIQDDRGAVGRIAVYNLQPTAAADCILPKGARIAIKEPYCTLHHDQRLVIRVDHPTDLVLVSPWSYGLPGGLKSAEMITSTTANALKTEGDTASKNKDWEHANAYYTDALALANKKNDADLVRAIHRGRAGARLQLGRFEFAIHDALAGMIPMTAENYNEKTKIANILLLYRAGEAAYGMGDFAQAKHHFEQALKIHPTNKQAQNGLARANERLVEESDKCDRLAMTLHMTDESILSPNTPLDHASFLTNTRVAPSDSSRGRGLFATKDLKTGDYILVEKAFHFANDSGTDIPMVLCYNTGLISRGPQAALRFAVIDKVRWNPMLAAKFLELCDVGIYYDSEGETEGLTDHDPSSPMELEFEDALGHTSIDDNTTPGNDAVTNNDEPLATDLTNMSDTENPPVDTNTPGNDEVTDNHNLSDHDKATANNPTTGTTGPNTSPITI